MAELKVNGMKAASRIKSMAFPIGTQLFIGGFPPGMMSRKHVSQLRFLQGCVDEIVLDSTKIDVENMDGINTGDLQSCEPETGLEVTLPQEPETTPMPQRPIETTTTLTLIYETPPPEPEPEFLEVRTTEEVVTIRPAKDEITPETTTVSDEPITRMSEPILAVCDDKICGEHGDCEVINATHIQCSCRDYYDGPACEQFKPIEYAAKFEGNAFIVFSADDFPHLTSEKEEIVELRLKTMAKYGVIFWQGQHPESTLTGEDYISIGLNDGYLIYSYELGGGAAQIVSKEPVNDGKEHIVRAVRKGRNGTLAVDFSPPVSGTSSGILAMLNVEGNIYIGGLPNLELMTGGLHSMNFVGCIADLTLNGQRMDLMANAIDGRNVKPCDDWQTSKKRKWLRSKKYRMRVI